MQQLQQKPGGSGQTQNTGVPSGGMPGGPFAGPGGGGVPGAGMPSGPFAGPGGGGIPGSGMPSSAFAGPGGGGVPSGGMSKSVMPGGSFAGPGQNVGGNRPSGTQNVAGATGAVTNNSYSGLVSGNAFITPSPFK